MTSSPGPFKTADDLVEEGRREVGGVVVGGAAGDNHFTVRLAVQKIANDLHGFGRGGRDTAGIGTEPEPEHGLIERVRAETPGGDFIHPEPAVLFPPEAVGLVGGKDQGAGAVRPFEAAFAGEIGGAFVVGANREDAAFALDHDVAGIVGGGSHDVHEGDVPNAGPDPFGARPRFAGSSAGHDQPDAPIAGGR